MRDYLLLILLVVTAHAHAQPAKNKKKIKLAPPGQREETSQDPGSATPLLYADPKLTQGTHFESKDGKVNITATCTDTMGMLHKKGDPGYDGCLRIRDRAQPDGTRDPRKGPTVGITIGK